MSSATYVSDAAVDANTALDLSAVMDEQFEQSGDDPLERVVVRANDGTVTVYNSVGRGEAGDPAAGEVAVTDGTQIALGDALATGDLVSVGYNPERGTGGGEERAV